MSDVLKEPRKCARPSCANVLAEKPKNKLYCSKKCTRLDRLPELVSHRPVLAKNTVGAIGELEVAADLLRRGYYVFRSVSPNSPYDLVAEKQGQILRIEVRTAQRLANGSLSFCKYRHETVSQYALVVWEERGVSILYLPELSS